MRGEEEGRRDGERDLEVTGRERCSICGAELGSDAVTFAAGDVVLFRPCPDCEKQARQVLRGSALLGARKLKVKLEELAGSELSAALRKAVRIARVVAEED